MRRAAKRDDNHADIVKALRKIGASVQDLASVGQGCVDILVGFRGVNYCLEIKDGAKPPSARKLTPDEKHWHKFWAGQKAIVNSEEEAIAVICE